MARYKVIYGLLSVALACSKSSPTSVTTSIPVNTPVNTAYCFHGLLNTSSSTSTSFSTALMSSLMLAGANSSWMQVCDEVIAKCLKEASYTHHALYRLHLTCGKLKVNSMQPPSVQQSQLIVFAMVLPAFFRPKGLKGHSQLMHMCIRYHFTANLHITETRSMLLLTKDDKK